MTDKRTISVTVNGTKYTKEVAVRVTLADFIRYELQLTGTHLGCEHGVCGACTVLVDGRPARACLTYAIQMEGHEISTIEGVAQQGKLSPLQQAMHEEHGLQCGFCTPGMIMTAVDILIRHRNPDEATIRHELEGNICRCTGYLNIIKAIRAVAAAG